MRHVDGASFHSILKLPPPPPPQVNKAKQTNKQQRQQQMFTDHTARMTSPPTPTTDRDLILLCYKLDTYNSDLVLQLFLLASNSTLHNNSCPRAEELCASRGGHPGLPSLVVRAVSVDVKQTLERIYSCLKGRHTRRRRRRRNVTR